VGKSPKPLSIMVTDEAMLAWPEVVALKEQGHLVAAFKDTMLSNVRSVEDWDIIMGPNAWLMDDMHREYLPLAIKAARAVRYPKKEKKS
jgi:hypothetical protein